MNNQIKKHAGFILIIIGAMILIVSCFTKLSDYNSILIGALILEIVGLIIQIIIKKKE
jgi:hypothetical protein